MVNFSVIEERANKEYIVLFKGSVIYRSRYIRASEHTIGKQSYLCVRSIEYRSHGNHYPAQAVVFDWDGKEIFNSSSLSFPWTHCARTSDDHIHLITLDDYPGEYNDIPSRRHYVVCTLNGEIVLDKPLEKNDELYGFCGLYGYAYGFKNKHAFLMDKNGNVHFKSESGYSECDHGVIREYSDKNNYYNKGLEKLPISDVVHNCINYSIVKNNNKFGVVDIEGKMAIPCIYDNIQPCAQNQPYVRVQKNNKWGLCSIYGSVVVQLEYEAISAEGENFYGFQKNGKWGFRSIQDSSITIPCNYEEVKEFSDGLAPVKKDGKWGYINKQNEILIPFIYDTAEPFTGGLAIVSDDTNETTHLPKQSVSSIDLNDNLPYSPVIPSWVNIDNIIKDCGLATCVIDGRRYIHTTESLFNDNNLAFHLSGSTNGGKVELKLIIIYKSEISLEETNNTFQLNRNGAIIFDDRLIFKIHSFDEEQKLNEYKSTSPISLDNLELLSQNEFTAELNGALHVSTRAILPKYKILAIKYLLTTESFTKEDAEELIKWAFPNRQKASEKVSNGLSERNDELVPDDDKLLKECIAKLSKLDFDNLDLLYKLISSPKKVSAYKELAELTKDSAKPHPLVKLLSRIPNKNALLEDIENVKANREFKENHKFISSVFKKKVELDDDTQKFINKLKRALAS